MGESLSKEVVKELALQRLHLTPLTQGKGKVDVPTIVRDIGGLQYGGHLLELFNRFDRFKPEWFDYWSENYTLIEGHVLRGALRIVNAEEYPYYFKATRSVSRRRASYQKCPQFLTDSHLTVLDFIKKHGPFTPSEFKERFSHEHPQLEALSKKLLYDLYNYGTVVRMGRKKQKPLYHAIEKSPYKLDMSHISEQKAKKWLLLRCLEVYGPFTAKDTAHWIGWTITETRKLLNGLLDEKKIVSIRIEDDQAAHFARSEDIDSLLFLEENIPESSFVRILFNDDAFLLGYYKKLGDYFGYHWIYPQLSEGIAWRAAILYGRQLAGEAIVEMYAQSPVLKVKKLLIRKQFTTSKALSKIEYEFSRHADFQSKALEMVAPTSVYNSFV